MSPDERQMAIWNALCAREQDTAENLAREFGVTVRTIYRDIQALMLSYPIEAVRGRYGGGFKIAEWYRMNKKTLSDEQVQTLKKLAGTLYGEEKKVIQKVLIQYKLRP